MTIQLAQCALVGFSLISAGVMVWLVSGSWQGHFQVAFGLFKAETFGQIKNGQTPWPVQPQETQAQLQNMC